MTSRVFTCLATGICLLLLGANVAHARAPAWIGTWGAAPEPPTQARGPFPATPSFAHQTIREVVRISVGGFRVRIRFTNEYGTQPLRIGAARVALADASGAPEAGTDRPVSFAGQSSASIPAGAPLLSDPIDLPVHPFSVLSISLYLPDETGPCTCHETGMQTAYVSESGDFTDRAFTPAKTFQGRAFLSGIEVETAGRAGAIVVLGDSISDGVGSTPNANHRWPDLFAERLAARRTRAQWGVVNMGISGNRVLQDGAGQSALTRFDRDVLAVPGATYLIVFEGVNDLGISFGHFEGPLAEFFKHQPTTDKATAEAVIAGYRQLIARAHEKGMKVLGATITPYGGAAYYSPEGETQREAINRWIRTSGAFDGVLDFDAVLRDPQDPTRMAAPLQAGDHLHGSDAGYEALARSIDLSLFK
ncbi:MAG TPA: SGNH/GDSL hydrolase family protein [Steroidobacteraceae bacterium]|nr:SGNH/GDSL hydrolase family protein [Steroidobacteraceae bacterium]